MMMEELIQEEDKPTLMRALLLKHRHVNDHGGFNFGLKKKYSSYSSLTVSDTLKTLQSCIFMFIYNFTQTESQEGIFSSFPFKIHIGKSTKTIYQLISPEHLATSLCIPIGRVLEIRQNLLDSAKIIIMHCFTFIFTSKAEV